MIERIHGNGPIKSGDWLAYTASGEFVVPWVGEIVSVTEGRARVYWQTTDDFQTVNIDEIEEY